MMHPTPIGAIVRSIVPEIHRQGTGDDQQDAFDEYRINRNEADPTLRNAAALVRAWNRFADIMGLDPA